MHMRGPSDPRSHGIEDETVVDDLNRHGEENGHRTMTMREDADDSIFPHETTGSFVSARSPGRPQEHRRRASPRE
jgi:hypothetical protein